MYGGLNEAGRGGKETLGLGSGEQQEGDTLQTATEHIRQVSQPVLMLLLLWLLWLVYNLILFPSNLSPSILPSRSISLSTALYRALSLALQEGIGIIPFFDEELGMVIGEATEMKEL